MKTIGIVGSRRRTKTEDYVKVEKAFLAEYEEGDELVSGGCPTGADHFAEMIAKIFQVPIKIHYARWKKHGKAAGFMRNGDIARDADVLIACVAPDRTGGTEDTIKKFAVFCPACGGSGQKPFDSEKEEDSCPNCDGSGRVSKGKVVLV